MAETATLFGLFGDFRPAWPRARFRQLTGVGPAPDPDSWLASINDAIRLKNIRTNADGERVVLEARYWVDLLAGGFPDGIPMVFSSMPDVEIRILGVNESKAGWLFVTRSDAGVELLIEGLPVEILLPPGLLALHPDDESATPPHEKSVGGFSGGGHDKQQVVYRRDGPSSVKTHLRVGVSPELDVTLATPVPVSFGKCRFMELPALAVHDFRLIPFPHIARESEEWLRHGIGPWVGAPEDPMGGCFALRGLELDPDKPPVSDVLSWAGGHAERTDVAHFVLDDLVVPFFSPWVLPVPRHITVGIRRNIENPLDPNDVFDFEQAPVQLHFGSDPAWGLVIESFFYESQPPEAIGDTLNLGITFSAAVYFGDINEPNNAITVGLGENLTPRIGYRREIDVNTGVLADDGTAFNLLKFDLLGMTIDIMGLTVGYSIGRAVGEGAGFGDSAELYGDLFITSEPTGGDDSFFKMRSLNNQPLKFAIEGLGWRQGSFHLEGVRMPDGAMLVFGPVGFILEELGFVAEDGANYFSFSGGLMVAPPGGTEGAVTVKRLRFRIAGSEDAPFFKLDGIFAYFRGSTLYIEVGGYFTDQTVEGVRRKEFGFTGTVLFELSAVQYGLNLDLITGDIEGPDEDFFYMMIQIVFTGLIPVYAVEIRGIRLLFSEDMLPKLSPVDASAGQMRYFSWYKNNDPVRVPGNRRLAAWTPGDDSWAFGIGATVSITGFGNVGRLTMFVLVLDSPSEGGFLVALELYLLTSKKPSAYAIVEIDLDNDRYAVLFGVDLKISDFIDGLPDWLNVITLKGELLIANKPNTIALGRLKDQKSWLSVLMDVDVLVFRSFLQIGLCIEWVDGGDSGIGFVARIEGGLNVSVVRISYHAGAGVVYISFTTGSVDQSLSAFIEAGVRAVLFGFLRLGLSVRATFKWVARGPSRTEFAAELRFETPWFLPDVSVRLEHTSGDVVPAELATFTAPLQSGTAQQPLLGSAEAPRGGGTLPLHLERWDSPELDPDTGEELPREAHSLTDLRAGALAEGPRVARFLANDAIEPVPTDSTIAIEFTALVDDALGIGPVPGGQGRQSSGDLSIRYELVGLRIRRRPRFDGGAWSVVDERIELSVDFDAPGGPVLTGSFGPQEITAFWAEDVRTANGTATKKLLVNSATPYDFVTDNAEADEETVRGNPDWPCCPRPRDKQGLWRIHRLHFRAELPGIDLEGHRLFKDSGSRWKAERSSVARPHVLGTLAPGVIVAATQALRPGTLYRADLDEAAVYCTARVAWFGHVHAELHLVAFEDGEEVGRSVTSATGAADFHLITLAGAKPFRAFELQVAMADEARPEPGVVVDLEESMTERFATALGPGLYVEADEFAYLAWEEYIRVVRDAALCDPSSDGFHDAWEARGKLFFLPNHQYEVETTVRLSAGHPSVETESAEVKEYLYFETKGLPGLNVQQRVGEEVEPYVRSAYAGGRGLVYREEPVAVAFQEDFHVAVPLALRPAGSTDERHQLFRMALTVRPDTASEPDTAFTATAEDWIVANRSTPGVSAVVVWKAMMTGSVMRSTGAASTNPLRLRLGRVVQRPGAPCPLGDPAQVIAPLLIAPPQGTPDPDDPAAELWAARQRFRAVVRQDGAPFVDRERFVAADLTALGFTSDGGGAAGGGWSVAEGEVRLADSGGILRYARFGEDDWNHVRIQLAVRVDTGTAGIALALGAGAGPPSRALYALVRPGGGGRELAMLRRTSGTELVSLGTAALAGDGEWVAITVSAFDDKLRLESGDAVIEAPRGALREGRLALVGAGPAAFRALKVEGLDLYAFSFATSRYRGFGDHVRSCDGQLRALAPDAMGPGSTTETVASLWAAMSAEVTAAMRPEAPAAARQTLFRRWAEGLGLALAQEVEHVQVSRLTTGAATQGFLLETPEPLDFTEEVTVALEQQVRVPGGDLSDLFPFVRALVDEVWGPTFDVEGPGGEDRIRAGTRTGVLELLDRGRLDTELRAAMTPATASPPAAPEMAARGRAGGGLAATRNGEELHLQFDEQAAGRGAAGLRAGDRVELVEVESVTASGTVEVAVWSGHAERRGGTLGARAERRAHRRLRGSEHLRAGSHPGRLEGVTIAVDPVRGRIIDWLFPRWEWRPAALRILQDETSLRALLIPVDSVGAPVTLNARRYQMHCRIDRARWQTTEPPDDDNRYRDEATVFLTV